MPLPSLSLLKRSINRGEGKMLSHPTRDQRGWGFFSSRIKPHTFLLLFNFLLLHPRQVHSEARNLFPIEFLLVVLFGKGRLPQPWSPCAAERSRHGAAPVKNTFKTEGIKMLLCCRKSCCFKAVSDKGAIARCWLPNPASTGSGSPSSPAVRWRCAGRESPGAGMRRQRWERAPASTGSKVFQVMSKGG